MRDANPTPDASGVPTLNRRQAAKIRTRGKVLASARALFAERGYEPATIRDIARGANMSTGAVFANFQDKAELFEAVLAEDLTRLAEQMQAASRGEGPARRRLAATLAAAYRAGLADLPLVQAVMSRSWFHPADAERRARAAVQPLSAIVRDLLATAVARGEIARDADLDLLSDMIWTGFTAGFRRAAYDGWDLTALTGALDRQMDLIFAGAREPSRTLSAA